MNSPVIATEMLKLLRRCMFSLEWTNSRMSGWSTLSMPMFAPRLVPPCLTVSVAASKTVMKETGPLAMPFVDRTTSLRGLKDEKLNPVPPPDLWMSAMFFTASKMPSMLSSTGRTKQADSWPSSLPAFISVGELGRNSLEVIISRNVDSAREAPSSPRHGTSASATARATRSNMPSGVSVIRPSWSLARYLLSSTLTALSDRTTVIRSPFPSVSRRAFAGAAAPRRDTNARRYSIIAPRGDGQYGQGQPPGLNGSLTSLHASPGRCYKYPVFERSPNGGGSLWQPSTTSA